jgi:mono/diheme cytochrome c family protein
VNRHNKFLTYSAFALVSCLSSLAIAQEPTTDDGVFTLDQVTAGETAYNGSCKACHDMKFYRDIWSYWEGKPLEGFWFRIVAEMPSDNPGSLLDEEYTNILAFILSDLGYPAGESFLDPYNGMSEITISQRK